MDYTESVTLFADAGPRTGRAFARARGEIRIDEYSRAGGAEWAIHKIDSEAVHIAGTNGKGSTAAMMESILRRAGYRTGLYTSPHLESINERIRVGWRGNQRTRNLRRRLRACMS